MAVTVSWKIDKLLNDISDGFVTKVSYSIIGLSDGVEKYTYQDEVTFVKPNSLPSDFVNYDDLDEATVIGWVKNTMDTPWTSDGSTQLQNLENSVKASVNLVLTPTTSSGLPASWS